MNLMNSASFMFLTLLNFSIRKSSNCGWSVSDRRWRNCVSRTLHFLRKWGVSLLSFLLANELTQEDTGVKVGVMRCSPLAWINNVQSIKEVFPWKPCKESMRNLISKSRNSLPWSKVTPFSHDLVSSPCEGELWLSTSNKREDYLFLQLDRFNLSIILSNSFLSWFSG